MKNPTTLISGTVTPKWTVPGERNLHFIYFFLCFCLLIFSPHQCSRAYGLFRQRSKSITDKADATDFIFSRISFTL
ncbi:MAG: hypothetical protein PUH91_02175, partial [Prevotella sp.]|nr:hypothetical protein [Prevotella sp.]